MKNLIFGLILGLGLSSVGFEASAQVLTPQDDGITPDPPKHYHHNMVFPYPFLRESDMLWSTRHWERIDLREKINHHLYYPVVPIPDRKSLYDVLVDGILNEGTIVEVFADDRFEIPLTPEQVQGYVQRLDTIRDPDNFTIVLLQEVNAIPDHGQIFRQGVVHHLLDMQIPAFAENCRSGCATGNDRLQIRVVFGRHMRFSRRAESHQA